MTALMEKEEKGNVGTNVYVNFSTSRSPVPHTKTA